ncbi:MAG: LysM peptidoglycan-binding domain-containing protein [Dehalococcoidia bacterium]
MRFLAVLLIIGLAAAAVSSGCSGVKYRHVNVSAGEYYSEDEYELLPDGRKDSYCSELQLELSVARQEFEEKSSEIQRTKDLIASLRSQVVPIETEVRRLEAEIRTLNAEIEEVKALPKTWKVRPGDTLTGIAMMDEIYNDIDKWEALFEANKDKIQDPYYIFPDTVLVIPRNWPTD